MHKKRAAFFDRDGTLIEDVNYLSDLNQIKILPGIIDFCRMLQNAGYLLFVVTNQSGIARGFFDESFVNKTHDYLKKQFKNNGVFIQKFYFCPHHPTQAKSKKYLFDCECRKPKTGMLEKAAQEFDVDLSKSLMFGDKLIDIDAGISAGCKSFYIQDILPVVYQEEKIKNMITRRQGYGS